MVIWLVVDCSGKENMGFEYYDELTHSDAEFNFSAMEYPNEKWIRKPVWEITVKVSALFPIGLFGLAGNLLVMSVIINNRNLRTPANYLIFNMAITDSATLVINPWMFLCRDFFQNYILGEFACKVEGFFEFSFLLTGVFTLIAVSYNRLLAIVLPHEAHMSRCQAKMVMLGSWVFGLLAGTPLIYFRKYQERQWLDFLEIFCNEDQVFLPIYWNVIISLIIWVPLGVMLICYSAIFYKLDQYEKNVLKREHPISVNYKKRVAKTLFVVVVTFACFRVPFTAVIFRRSQLLQMSTPFTFGNDFVILWFACHYLMFANAALNPLIYGLTNEGFRRAFETTAFTQWMFPEPPKSKEKKVWMIEPKEEKSMFTARARFKNVSGEIRRTVSQGQFKVRDEVPPRQNTQGPPHSLHMEFHM